MATKVQKQTVWALWLQNHAETLEPHLGEINHRGESKIWHPEPLTHGKLLHAMLHWENLWAATTATTTTAAISGSKPACKTFGRPNRLAPCVMQNSPSYPQDKPAHTPKKTLNNKQWTVIYYNSRRGGIAESAPEKLGKELILAEPSVNKS
jgi:hypothetical protein